MEEDIPEAVNDPVMEIKNVTGLLESVHSVEVKLADIQADVNSPLYSAKSFEQLGLPENILKGVYAMKFNKPSKVQERALPLLLSNPPQNMIAQSQSGTGKTAAFVLTMLCRVDTGLEAPQALCLSPSRELARQIVDVVEQMGKFANIRYTTALKEGNHPSAADHPSNGANGRNKSKITEQIVIGTPGTALDLYKRGILDLSQLKILVFDEADVMLDKQGMGTQSVRLKNYCPRDVQTLLFSATFKPEVMTFASRVVPSPNVLTLKKEELSIDAISQFYMKCNDYKHKFEMLSAIYGLLSMSQSIIFVHSRNTAEQVQAHMQLEGHQTSLLHGGMGPAERDAVIDAFRRGLSRVLITTNVLARGIDVPQVYLVINFDMPVDVNNDPDIETYLHRIGRTGRFGRSGVSINFIHDARSFDVMMAIRNYYKKPMVEIPTHDLEAIDSSLKSAI